MSFVSIRMPDFLQEEKRAQQELWEATAGSGGNGAPARPPDPRAAAAAEAAAAGAAGPSPHEGQYEEPPGLRLDTDMWNLIYGDPTQSAGYFIGGAGETGARWATSNGGFTGRAHEKGLESNIGLGGNLGLDLDADFKAKAAELALMSGETNLGELYGKLGSKGAYEAGLRGSYDLGGLQLDPAFARTQDAVRASLGLGNRDYAYTHGDDGSSSFEAGITSQNDASKVRFGQTWGAGGEAQKLSLDHKLGDSSISASMQAANDAVSGFSLGAAHKLDNGSLNAGVSWKDAPEGGTTSYNVGANVKPADDLSLSGRVNGSNGPAGSATGLGLGFDYGKKDGLSLGGSLDASFGADGHDAIKAGLHQAYGSPALANRLSLSATSDSLTGDRLDASGSVTGRLGGDLYGTGFGSYGQAAGADPSWFAGGGLTYMPSSKLGLSAAAGYGSEGLEGRLQADFFKKSVNGADSLEEQRAKALMSIYLGVSAGGSRMSSVYGAGSLEEQLNQPNDPTVTLGVKLPF